MKNNNKQNNIAFIFVGMMLGAVMMITVDAADSENRSLTLIIAGFFALGGLFFFLRAIFDTFIIPYINRRRAALRALGKDGIRIMRKDETARLAYKGIYAIMSGKFPQAEEYLQQALSRSDVRQNQLFCIEWLIRLYEATEADSRLLWCYRKAVEFSPDNPEAQSRLGHAYFSDGKLDQADYCFRQALRYDPNNGYSYFSLAKIQLVRGQDEQAYETLEKLLKINENHPLCHAELADYYALKGDRENAEAECKKAQLCGIKDPDELNRRINAMLSFNETKFSGEDLPSMYYRRIEKPSDEDREKLPEKTEKPTTEQ